MAQVALAWLFAKPGVCSPIIGATKESHISDAVTSCDITLDEVDMSELESAYVPRLFSDFS
jgi:1-deoxyxylulose-5-phosphate synthase